MLMSIMHQKREKCKAVFYAYDIVNNASENRKLQEGTDRVSQTCDNYNLTFSTKKTEVVH